MLGNCLRVEASLRVSIPPEYNAATQKKDPTELGKSYQVPGTYVRTYVLTTCLPRSVGRSNR